MEFLMSNSLSLNDLMSFDSKNKAEKEKIFIKGEDGTFKAGVKPKYTYTLPSGSYMVAKEPFSGSLIFKSKEIKNDDIIDINSETVNRIKEELDNLEASKSRYLEYGMVFKRGILVHGSPGNGKTSLLNSIAEDYTNKDNIIIYFNDSSRSAVKEGIDFINQTSPDKNILLIAEDLDSQMGSEEFLLSLFDGENQCNNLIVLATTNYKDKLSPRLLRPSRLDTIIEFKSPTIESRKLYLNSKLKGDHLKSINEMVTATEGLSMAELKEVLISFTCLNRDIEDAVETIKRNRINY